jgi:putative DNA primase/helicase
MACGGDKSRIWFVGDVHGPDGRSVFDPARHLKKLEEAVARIGGIDFLIVDPVVSAVAGDSHKSAETRRGLQPIVDIANRFNCVAIGISHFSKGSAGRDPIERITGSIAFGALPRIVLAAAKYPEEDGSTRRTLVRAKSNIGPDGGGFDYSLDQIEIGGFPGVTGSRLLWGTSRDGTARELLAEADVDNTGERSATEEAVEWLETLLAHGSMEAKKAQSEARQAGISEKALRSARERLGIKPIKSSFAGGWLWALPGVEDARDVEHAQECVTRNKGILGDRGHLGGSETVEAEL